MDCTKLYILILQTIKLYASLLRLAFCDMIISLEGLGIWNGGSYKCKNSWIHYYVKGSDSW